MNSSKGFKNCTSPARCQNGGSVWLIKHMLRIHPRLHQVLGLFCSPIHGTCKEHEWEGGGGARGPSSTPGGAEATPQGGGRGRPTPLQLAPSGWFPCSSHSVETGNCVNLSNRFFWNPPSLGVLWERHSRSHTNASIHSLDKQKPFVEGVSVW